MKEETKTEKCPDCAGTGREDEGTCGYRGVCRRCGGTGKVVVASDNKKEDNKQ